MLPEKAQELTELAQLNNILRRQVDNKFIPYNIACTPFQTSTQFYQRMRQLSALWQHLCFLASKDDQLIFRIFTTLRKQDEWIQFLMSVWQAQRSHHKDSLIFTRCDYFINKQDQNPKLTEYNLMCVGMAFNMRQLTLIHKQADEANSDQYFDNDALQQRVRLIILYYREKKIQGKFVIVIGDVESTILEQKYLEGELTKGGIRCKRLKCKQLIEHGRICENNDFYYKNQLISFVYFRTGYNLSMYTDNSNQVLKIRKAIASSNIISIPNVAIELINLKRMQVELSKPQVMSKYLTKNQVETLRTTIIDTWEFDNMPEVKFQQFLQTMKLNMDDYILKPNKEGGDNNYFGPEGYQKLKQLTPQKRKLYIVQKKINSQIFNNEIIYHGTSLVKKTCTYEIGIYGTILQMDGKIISNQAHGYLIRSKGEGQNQGMILAGTDGLVPRKKLSV